MLILHKKPISQNPEKKSKPKNATGSTSKSAKEPPPKKRKSDEHASTARPKTKKAKTTPEHPAEDSDVEMKDRDDEEELEDESDGPQAHYEKLSAMAAADKQV